MISKLRDIPAALREIMCFSEKYMTYEKLNLNQNDQVG